MFPPTEIRNWNVRHIEVSWYFILETFGLFIHRVPVVNSLSTEPIGRYRVTRLYNITSEQMAPTKTDTRLFGTYLSNGCCLPIVQQHDTSFMSTILFPHKRSPPVVEASTKTPIVDNTIRHCDT